jgi:hypothetical protein
MGRGTAVMAIRAGSQVGRSGDGAISDMKEAVEGVSLEVKSAGISKKLMTPKGNQFVWAKSRTE